MVKKVILLAAALLAVGMAVPSTRARIVNDVFKPIQNGVNAKLVPSRLNAMADQIDVRLRRAEGFPGNWEAWLRRDYSGVPEDPWGNMYYLNASRRNYTVGSSGPDGLPNTDDDITETRDIPR